MKTLLHPVTPGLQAIETDLALDAEPSAASATHAAPDTPLPLTPTVGDVTTLSVITGTNGNDLLLGTAGNDTINGLGGSDTIYGGTAGGNFIDAGAGDDTIYGARGNDFLIGGDGNDRIFASGDGNTLEGDA